MKDTKITKLGGLEISISETFVIFVVRQQIGKTTSLTNTEKE